MTRSKSYERAMTPAEMWSDKPDSRWAKSKVSRARLNVMAANAKENLHLDAAQASRAKEMNPQMTNTKTHRSNGHQDPVALERRAAKIRAEYRAVYGPDSPHSYFKDLYVAGVAQNEQIAMAERQVQGTGGFTEPIPGHIEPGHRWAPGELVNVHGGDVKDAMDRLATVPEADGERSRSGAEKRAISSTTGAGGDFVSPAGATPGFIADLFATAARNESVMLSVFPPKPLPANGETVSAPRFSTGGAVAVQVDGGAVQSTDETTALAQAPVTTIAGDNDFSQQILDRTSPNMDVYIAAELGRALGEAIDKAILSGAGSAGQTRGLLNVVGATARSYTDATPTQAENFSAILGLYADFVAALGGTPDTVLLAPRRAAFLEAQYNATNMAAFNRLGMSVVVVPAMPTTLGAGTNEDRVILVDSDEIDLFLDQPKIRISPDVLSGNLQVRWTVWQYGALLANRQPAATGILSGTGLASTGVTF